MAEGFTQTLQPLVGDDAQQTMFMVCLLRRASGRCASQGAAQDDVGRFVQRVADAQEVCHQKVGACVLADGDERLRPAYLSAKSLLADTAHLTRPS